MLSPMITHFSNFQAIAIVVLFVVSNSVFGQDSKIPPSSEAPHESDSVISNNEVIKTDDVPNKVSRIHRRIGDQVLQMSRDLDEFFSDEDLDDDSEKTRFRVRSEFRILEKSESEFQVKIRGHAVLPRTEKRLGLYLESMREDFLTNFDEVLGSEGTDSELNNLLEDENVSGIRLSLFRDLPGSWNLDGGLKLSSNPKTRVRLRWKYGTPVFEQWNFLSIQSLEYREELGTGQRTQFRLERIFIDHLLRFSLEGVRFEKEPLQSVFSTEVFFPLNDEANLRLSTSLAGFLGTEPAIKGVTLEAALRKKIYFDWLYGEIAPRLFWPGRPSEERDVSTLLALEIVFQ
jgi:hypothetical protein